MGVSRTVLQVESDPGKSFVHEDWTVAGKTVPIQLQLQASSPQLGGPVVGEDHVEAFSQAITRNHQ